MGTRGLRPLLAAAVLTGWAAAAAAQDDALTPESLKQLLTVMGYEPRDVGNGVCEVAFDRDGWKVFAQVSLSKDGSLVWLEAKFAPIAEPERAPAGALLALLEENERIGPAHFAFRRQDGRVHLYRPLPNRGVTAAVMRKQLDAFDELVRRTEKLWDPDNFKPAAPDAGERARLRGTWKVVAIEQKGAKLSEADVAASRMSLTFTPDKLIIRRKGAPDDVTAYALDPAADPPRIDITNKQKKVEKGVYRLDGDTLTLCFADPGEPRPAGFATAPDFKGGLLTMKKEPEPFKE